MAYFFIPDRVNYAIIIALTVSVFLAHSAYLFPDYCGFLSAFFLIPVFYAGFLIKKSAGWYGLYWGLLFFAVQLSWLIFTLPDYVKSPWHWIIYSILTIYFALLAVIWFWLSVQLNCWAVGACLYYYFLDHGACWFLGHWWGYPLSNVLLPLATYNTLIKPVGWLGIELYQMLIIFFQMGIAFGIFTNNKKVLFIVIFATLASITVSTWWCTKMPIVMPAIGCVMPVITAKKNAEQVAYELTYALIAYADIHREVQILCAPESAFPFIINEQQSAIALWQENVPLNDKLFILGAHIKEGDAVFNSLVGISEGHIVFTYHKRHLMPFIEYEQAWATTIFTKRRNAFSAGKNEHEPVKHGSYQLVPFICCEFFFEHQPPAGSQEVPLLCLVNDSHFLPYVGILLLLYARLKAVAFERVVIYCSHRYGVIIQPDGTSALAR